MSAFSAVWGISIDSDAGEPSRLCAHQDAARSSATQRWRPLRAAPDRAGQREHPAGPPRLQHERGYDSGRSVALLVEGVRGMAQAARARQANAAVDGDDVRQVRIAV